MSRSLFLKIVVLCAACASGAAFAQLDFMKWINPGPLARPHDTLEGVSNCGLCHATAKGIPDSKCLDCHTEIRERLEKKLGYHARQTDPCVKCHSDHKGRDYDLLALKRVKFDHQNVGWALNGAHGKVDCRKCHTQTRVDVKTHLPTRRPSYLGAPTVCLPCHPDIHKSAEPAWQRCELCHDESVWKPMRTPAEFDHTRDSKYPLTGKHAKIDCYACHKQKTWKPLSFARCLDCHPDPHKNAFGPKCEICHVTANWKKLLMKTPQGVRFDHQKTKFSLSGAHFQVPCLTCHGPTIGKMTGFDQCTGCHNNPHGNEFQEKWNVRKECSKCHVTEGWTILNFQHGRDSRYDLLDKHKQVPCEQCHVDRKYRWLASSPDCDVCHLDVHVKQFTKACVVCHTQKGFDTLKFDHNKDSKFPIVGKHKAVGCEKCHEAGKYTGIDHRCQGCHTDFHNNQLGVECSRCHAPIAMNDIAFDHKHASRFRVEGAHEKVACNQCHLDYHYRPLSSECSSCHEDAHKGTFGPACQRCHVTSSFRPRKGFHDFGAFSLGGVHDRLDCKVCHAPTSPGRIQPAQCAACHRDPHLGSLGPDCAGCHTQVAWLPSKFRHTQTGFQLSGAHRFLSCDRCHFNRVFGGLPQDCAFCHQKDFVPATKIPQHLGASSQCESCHYTYGWRPAKR
ncbi:MAG: hypothetical protein V1495_07860 [Pseudomonadota bacterium]